MNKITPFLIVQQDLLQVEKDLEAIIHSPVHTVNEIHRHLLKAGGKRLRPALYLLCAKTKEALNRPLLTTAVAIELIHMATLVHDDVLDNAETRRSLPTANVIWGNQVTVLAGDYLFAKAFSMIAGLNDGESLKKLTEVVCAVCEGEIIQNKTIFDVSQTEADYLDRLAKKTADFIAVSCELGAKSAGLGAGEVDALRTFGYDIGMAFQLTDDILDVTASEEQVGKPVGNDLRQGIITLPVIYALQNSPRREELREMIAARDMTEENIRLALKIVKEAGAVQYAYKKTDDYLKHSLSVLPSCLSEHVRQALHNVVEFIGMRKY